MTWCLIFLVALYLILIFVINEEPPMLTELKKRYRTTLQVLRDTGDPLWHPVLKPSILTGIYGKKDGVIGSNVNKGYEIYICLDGDDVNSAMYVLLHELAHMSVPEYDHTTSYWDNFSKLKKVAIDNGIYQKNGVRQYCGDTVKD
jgi:hypothetical protein